jgi:hypothetical protein
VRAVPSSHQIFFKSNIQTTRGSSLKRTALTVLLLFVLLVLIIGGTYLFFLTNHPTKNGLLSCSNPSSYGRQPGWSFDCGDRSVSDSLLNITLNNYHFASGKDIQYELDPYSVFLLANITIRNVGGGNAPIDASWYAIFGNTSLTSTTIATSSSQSVFGNQIFLQNVTFPSSNPTESFPITNGGLNLAAGQSLDCWLIFYVPNVNLSINSSSVAQLYVSQLMYFQDGYGGQYEGGGAYGCPCQTVDTELIIIPKSS